MSKRGESDEDLEKQVIECTTQLEPAHKEPEVFNYTVSHDLWSVLRKINICLKILRDDFAGFPDDTGNTRFRFIVTDLPPSFSYLGAISLVISNLFSNAIKYSSRPEMQHYYSSWSSYKGRWSSGEWSNILFFSSCSLKCLSGPVSMKLSFPVSRSRYLTVFTFFGILYSS